MAINAPLEKSLAVPDYPIWRLTVEQYHQMIDAGILTDDDPVELLEGWLIIRFPKTPPHSVSTHLTREALTTLVPSGWHVDTHYPITTADSEPEPDVVIVRGDRRAYTDHHPYPGDVALVVEVSDSTLQRDRMLKLRLYANARIPVYWILNLPDGRLEVYRDPDDAGGYRQHVDYQAADDAPLEIGGQEVARVSVAALLG